jgi:hypothetical protein
MTKTEAQRTFLIGTIVRPSEPGHLFGGVRTVGKVTDRHSVRSNVGDWETYIEVTDQVTGDIFGWYSPDELVVA